MPEGDLTRDILSGPHHDKDPRNGLNSISSSKSCLKREHRSISRDTMQSDREEWTQTEAAASKSSLQP
ncbi:hypothetical protein [Tunturiibacter gelidoferens]|jgi:hypothetical protein|uniref:Uncharacterized protein n=1 Tax=Tunturiibacter gelidiferens TaxID=3069689 RepID=A0A9X0U5V3_9BACT|nr:hypothetical protein [Edaphobacter lichenicola]MBB5330924.1 hypothetical protein [Edaphobacter lichenicola]